jgi:hypothetical protein
MTVCHGLTGRTPLSLQSFFLLCLALRLDPGDTLNNAATAGRQSLQALRASGDA